MVARFTISNCQHLDVLDDCNGCKYNLIKTLLLIAIAIEVLLNVLYLYIQYPSPRPIRDQYVIWINAHKFYGEVQ